MVSLYSVPTTIRVAFLVDQAQAQTPPYALYNILLACWSLVPGIGADPEYVVSYQPVICITNGK